MQTSAQIHRGGCLCGRIRYRIADAPLRSSLCHCRTCRKIVSAPTLPFVVFPAGSFVFEGDSPQSFASSEHVVRTFCGTCGSPLTYATTTDPQTIDVMTVSLDNPEAYPPQDHVWVSEKLGWDVIADKLPQHPGGLPDKD
jgi:hypothetical protein